VDAKIKQTSKLKRTHSIKISHYWEILDMMLAKCKHDTLSTTTEKQTKCYGSRHFEDINFFNMTLRQEAEVGDT
jgi:hypothetical protein